MARPQATIPALALLTLTCWAVACGDGATEPPPGVTQPPPPPPDPPRATTLTVTPAADTLTALGETVRLTAQVLDQNGQTMAGAPVSWSSGDASIATVDASGLVTAAGNGTATITATSGSASGSAAVTIEVTLATSDRAALVALHNATGGPNWRNNGNWLTDAPLGEWHGVTADGAGRVVELRLSENGLSGALPPELGSLTNLQILLLDWNDLSGAIPPELGNLANLQTLSIYTNNLSGAIPSALLGLRLDVFEWHTNSGLCAPGISVFVEWLAGVESWRGPLCNASDRVVLNGLYEHTGGDEWTESGGWLESSALDAWHGVETDSQGRVTELDLSGNGLSGTLPGSITDLGQLTGLRIGGNELGGPLPLALSRLDLEVFHYDGTDLCEPANAQFREWLNGIPSLRGTEVQCAPLTDREVLVSLYTATGGDRWTNRAGWLTEAPLDEWHGVTADGQGRVSGISLPFNGLFGVFPPELSALSDLQSLNLDGNELSGVLLPELGNLANLRSLALRFNELSGAIPPELGDLAGLEFLELNNNNLSGSVPPELGNLANLQALDLRGNGLSGTIPPELGNLTRLGQLSLLGNQLSGTIPPELGNLADLHTLYLGGNALSGTIPPELGNLANLKDLWLETNNLSGPVPATFGGLANLNVLLLSQNAGLAGALPAEILNLELDWLMATGTDLCLPRERAFAEWIATTTRQWIESCGEPPAAYLVQAVQSLKHPVPLVAGEDALLRVFVTGAMETAEGMPEVRARFYLNGTERHVADIPRSSTAIPTEIDEGDLAKSANAVIPGRIVRPGLEMVVEIDPGGTLDQGLGVPGRLPEEGRLAIDVRDIPVLDLTVIPFLWTQNPDSTVLGQVDGMADDPEGHALLEETRVLLPVRDIEVTAHAPVTSTSNNGSDLHVQVQAIRVLEGGRGHWMGTMSGEVTGVYGLAETPGWSLFSFPGSGIIAHELGHTMWLWHAPCGVFGPDPSYPYPDGSIGAWGYDFRSGRLVPPTWWDNMGYCGPAWISDYHFTSALKHRLATEGASAASRAAAPARSLLLWGGVNAAGTPYLNPAFVADAPPALPDSAGAWAVTGRDAGGRELFSLSFAMSAVLDDEEKETSSFVFALPARPGWAEALASVTLSGPEGTVVLDGRSDMPMTILREPVTGRVRGFLRDAALSAQVAADAAGARAGSSLDVLFSRGIPDRAAWNR